MATPAPIPWNTPILQVDPATKRLVPGYLIGKDWGNWLSSSIVSQIANTPQFYPTVGAANQNASIPVTPMALPALAAGLYRVTTYVRITTADPASSSLTFTISWTDGGVACSVSGAAMTGNTLNTTQSFTVMMTIDASTPISYSATYASNTAGAMHYKFVILVEAV